MTIPLGIPEARATQLGARTPQELSRTAREALALEAYREDRLGGPQGAEALGISRMRWEQFLEDHCVSKDAYTVGDLERDVATLQRLRADGRFPPVP